MSGVMIFFNLKSIEKNKYTWKNKVYPEFVNNTILSGRNDVIAGEK